MVSVPSICSTLSFTNRCLLTQPKIILLARCSCKRFIAFYWQTFIDTIFPLLWDGRKKKLPNDDTSSLAFVGQILCQIPFIRQSLLNIVKSLFAFGRHQMKMIPRSNCHEQRRASCSHVFGKARNITTAFQTQRRSHFSIHAMIHHNVFYGATQIDDGFQAHLSSALLHDAP